MLNAKKLALAGAIMWSLFSFLFISFILLTGYGEGFMNFMLSSFIKGYQLNWWASLVALVGGFIDGFIFFFFLAYIYNLLNRPKKINQESQSIYD